VPQLLLPGERKVQVLGKVLVSLEPRDDGCVVRGGVRERLDRQLATLDRAHAVTQALKYVLVVGRVHYDDYRRVVLRGRPDHRRPTDVDLLESLLEAHIRPCDGLAERVEVR